MVSRGEIVTPNQKEEYKRLAKAAVSKAGLELVTLVPEDDYIETVCPKCNRTDIFCKSELGHIRCSSCYHKQRREDFDRRSKKLVEAAGFELTYASYEDDFIEAECPVCENVTSFRLRELDRISCKFCSMKEAASENGFDLYWDAESYGEPWEKLLDEWKEDNCDEPTILVCRSCGEIHILSADTNDAIDQVKQYRCRCHVITPELKELIAARGFFVELQSCPIGFYTLNPGEMALLCNRCGEEVIFNIDDDALTDKIASLTCQSDDCSLETDQVALTRQGRMAWCYDTLHGVSIIKLTAFNEFSFENGAHMAIPEEGNHEVYFAVDPSDSDFAFAFIVYPDETDAWLSKYLLFRFEIDSWGTSEINVEISARWPGYYDELYRLIKQDIADGDNRDPVMTTITSDRYIGAYNALHNLNGDIWGFAHILSCLESLNNAFGQAINDPERIKGPKDPYLQQFLSLHTCPVCQKAYTSTETICLRCGFPDLNRVFINRQEAELWKEHIVLPYKQRYDRRNK